MADEKTILGQIRTLPANFWFANIMEALERLAFFSVRAISGLYLVASTERNGLGLSYDDKGEIYMWWALIQCLLPMVSGGFTDRYGYRKSLAVAYTLNILGYLLMAFALPISQSVAAGTGWESAGFFVFLLAACLVGTGTAVFKPAVQGTIAKSTSEETSSMGWGVFYWVVNIGGALAPMIAAPLRGEIDWDSVFIAGAVFTALNFVPLIFLYKEPERGATVKAGEKPVGPVEVFVSSVMTILRDGKLILFLLFYSCFWIMFQQLWDLMPNFIDEWVDTSDVAGAFSGVNEGWVLDTGQVKAEMIIALNPLTVLALVIPISWLVSKTHKVATMVIGMTIAVVGFVGTGATAMGFFCCMMLLVFSIGEMTCNPTFSAYIAVIAPKAKKALYMGYSQLPLAIGWAAGSKIGGLLYEKLGSKFGLARQYMVEHLGMDPAAVMDVEKLPQTEVMGALAGALGKGEDPASIAEATRVLWEQYDPYMVWYYLGIFGAAGTLGMLIFYVVIRASLKK